MHFLSFSAVLVAIFGLTVAGYVQHSPYAFGSDGGHSEEVSYAVATTHEHGGHSGGHNDAQYFAHDLSHDEGHGHHAYPKYEYDYGVKDTKTGDIKSHSESRDGDRVKGSYTLKEADGTTRHVEYSSDKKKGFTAVVHKLGQANADHQYYGHENHDSGDYGHASSYVVVKKHEEQKHLGY